MPGKRKVRCRAGALVGHPLNRADPALAGVLASALGSSINSNTQKGYDSAAASYERYCSVRRLRPYPADPITLAGWIVWQAMQISVASVKVYCAGVRSAQIDKGYEWTLTGNQLVARAMRYIKKRYGMAGKGLKVPISLGTLKLLCTKLAGWPRPDRMSHDDRLFVAASSVAVVGFLRGGEFLTSPGGGRPLLMSKDVVVTSRNGCLLRLKWRWPAQKQDGGSPLSLLTVLAWACYAPLIRCAG
jgi:hypothetical protein